MAFTFPYIQRLGLFQFQVLNAMHILHTFPFFSFSNRSSEWDILCRGEKEE